MKSEELYISVDIEAAGPIPGEYSMLSIGASIVGQPAVCFYAELKPLHKNAVAEALRVSRLDMKELALNGKDAKSVMEELRDWVKIISGDRKPVFVGFNA